LGAYAGLFRPASAREVFASAFRSSLGVGPSSRTVLPLLLLANRQRPHPFGCDLAINVSFRGFILRLDPFLFARFSIPARRKWTLLRFALDGVSASASRPASWPASPSAVFPCRCKQRQIPRSRVLTCRSPIPSAFWAGSPLGFVTLSTLSR
jgi:hypothetical protein